MKPVRPQTAPNKASHFIEPSVSSNPAAGQGLYLSTLDRFGDDIRVGRVDDLYCSYLCANVTVHGRVSNLPCLWLQAAAGRWMGARTFSPPNIGTEVLIWMPQDAKFGVILGELHAPGVTDAYGAGKVGNTDVDIFGKDAAQNADIWEMNGFMINAGSGAGPDVFPGDYVIGNELQAAIGMLKFLSVIKGSPQACIEAYVWDDLLRIISRNYQHRSAGAEHEMMCDSGEVDDIIERTCQLAEGMGEDPDSASAEDAIKVAAAAAAGGAKVAGAAGGGGADKKNGVGRWRQRKFFGPLANMFQEFISKPSKGAGKLSDNPDPDTGYRQNVVEMGGYELTRTVTGMRFHKCLQVAVPKRKHYPDDMNGASGSPDRQPLEPFTFSTGPGPSGHVAQIRDQAAYIYNRLFPQRFLEKNKDWDVPDEAECPTIGTDGPPPGIGGFYREFPTMIPVEASINDGRLTAPGDAIIDLNDDGSIFLKDIWGSELRMSGGHIVISASKDIMMFAGGSLVSMAGDDVIVKAKKSMDLTTSEGQFRIYSTEDLFVHSKNGGMLFSQDGPGYAYEPDKKGEERRLAGILFKCGTDDQLGGFQVKASSAAFTLAGGGGGGDGVFYVGPSDLSTTGRPDIINRCRGRFNWFGDANTTGFELWKFEPEGYVEFYGGGMFCSDQIRTDSNVEARHDGIFGGTVSENTDWSKVPKLSELIEKAKCFDEDEWKSFQYPYNSDDLSDVDFTFRTSDDYATVGKDVAWIETFWQRDLDSQDLETWKDAEHTDKSRPYPGKEKFGKSWWTYEDKNINRYGRPVSRDSLSKNGGKWSQSSWDTIKVHPQR